MRAAIRAHPSAAQYLSIEYGDYFLLTEPRPAGTGGRQVGWLAIYPLDVVKSVLHSQPPGCSNTLGPVEVTRRLLAEGGHARLFRGLTPTLVRAGPVAGVLLPTFDATLDALHAWSGPDDCVDAPRPRQAF